jgi:hypothetical protein
MSSRQKTQKKPKAAKEVKNVTEPASIPAVLRNVGRAAAILIIAGIASPVSQLNLSPVYGSIPASLNHQRAMTVTAVTALLARKGLKRYVSANVAEYVAVVAYWIPVIQFLIFPYSGKLGIEYGPLIVELLTYFSLLFLSMYAVADLLESIDLSQFELPPTVGEFAFPIASYITVSSIAKISSSIIPSFIGTSIYFTRVGLQMLLASALAFITPSRMIFLAFPAILQTHTTHRTTASNSRIRLSSPPKTTHFSPAKSRSQVTSPLSRTPQTTPSAFSAATTPSSAANGSSHPKPTAEANASANPSLPSSSCSKPFASLNPSPQPLLSSPTARSPP